jgi:hypothetical protein
MRFAYFRRRREATFRRDRQKRHAREGRREELRQLEQEELRQLEQKVAALRQPEGDALIRREVDKQTRFLTALSLIAACNLPDITTGHALSAPQNNCSPLSTQVRVRLSFVGAQFLFALPARICDPVVVAPLVGTAIARTNHRTRISKATIWFHHIVPKARAPPYLCGT